MRMTLFQFSPCSYLLQSICPLLQGARNEIFAMQPAPIQVSYMGFPATTGASYIDYLITDEANIEVCSVLI